MTPDLPFQDKLYLIASCSLMALATFAACQPLLKAILKPNKPNEQGSSPHYLRRQQLRKSSQLFAALEPWIVGLSGLIERRAPWFVTLPIPLQSSVQDGKTAGSIDARAILARTFALIFGHPERLTRAARMRTTEQPWSVAELTAAGMYFAGGTFAMVFLQLLNRWSASWLWVGSSVSAWLVYRLWIRDAIERADNRRHEILRFLPHALDSISMGLSADGNLSTALEELIADYPSHPLCQEFAIVRANMQVGMFHLDAINDMSERVHLPELQELVGILKQKDEHGTPIYESVQRLAHKVRKERLSWLEKAIGQAETSLTLPTTLITLACLLCISAPFVLSIVKSGLLP